MTTTVPFISQSIIKGFAEYEQGEACGLQFKAKYIDRVFFGSTQAQNVGNYFEWLVTGTPLRGGLIPQPEYTKDGVTLTAPYWVIKQQAENCKRYLEHYQVNILESSLQVTTDDGETGLLDLLVEIGPEQTLAIIDLKTSGLLYDKWSPFGWHEDALAEKWNIMVQAVHYKLICKKKYGEELPFFFWVFNQKNQIDAEIFQVILDGHRLEQHQTIIDATRSKLSLEMAMGFTARPNLQRCHNCPLKATCEFYQGTPNIKPIYY